MDRLRRREPLLWALSGVVITFIAWEVVARGPMADVVAFPPFTTTVAQLVRDMGTADFWTALLDTLRTAAIGFVLALAIGVPAGFAVGLSPVARAIVRVPMEFLRPIPGIVILPLLVLVLGPTIRMGWTLVTYAAFFPFFVQSLAGVQDADPVALETARSFRLRRPERLLRIVLPGTAPFLATAARSATAAALVVAVVAELIGGAPGLGQSLAVARSNGVYPRLYGYVLVFGVLGVAANAVVAALSRRWLFWHESMRKDDE